jgi:hypothetical protein
VVHPDAQAVTWLGIECDGATYHRSATARDRDKLREQVLRGLGWEILRVWSTDWWVDRAFHDPSYDTPLRDMIAHVVNVEGPILGLTLARRIARAHGWARTGGRIQERVLGMAEKHHAHLREEAGIFFWPAGQDPHAPVPFRRPAPNVTRAADEMCRSELDDLARQVLKPGTTDEEAMLAMAQALGFNKPRFNMHQALSEALARCR